MPIPKFDIEEVEARLLKTLKEIIRKTYSEEVVEYFFENYELFLSMRAIRIKHKHQAAPSRISKEAEEAVRILIEKSWGIE